MGHVPLPMPKIPDDATDEEVERIVTAYREYLEANLRHNDRMLRWGLRFIMLLTLVLLAIAVLVWHMPQF